MPEGDTVARLARDLHDALAGQKIEASDFRVPAHATADLRGWTVSEAVSRGKHLLLRTLSPDGAKRLTIHSHLRMDGSWRVLPRANRTEAAAQADRESTKPQSDPSAAARRIAPRRGFPASRWFAGADVRIVLTFGPVVAVARAVSEVRLMPTDNEAQYLAHLGPDPLGADWDAPAAVSRLKTAHAQLLSTALLDQRVLAGVGNVYRCEVLFLMGINPKTVVADVSNLDAVVDCAAHLLQSNVDRRWRVTTGDERRGRELWVYDRAGQPCRRCGSGIRRSTIGAANAHDAPRIIFWCPTCQA